MMGCRRVTTYSSAAAKTAIGLALSVVIVAGAAFAREPEYELVATPHVGGVSSITFSADGKFVLTGTDDGTHFQRTYEGNAILWDFGSAKPVRAYAGPSTIAAISPNSKIVVTGEYYYGSWGAKPDEADETTIARDAVTGQTIGRFRLEQAGHRALAVSPDSKLVATKNGDEEAIVWDIATGKRLRSIRPGDAITHFAFSPDGTSLFTGGSCAKLWNLAMGEPQPLFIGGGGSIRATSRDGKLALTADKVGAAILWDLATGRELQRFEELDAFHFSVPDAVFAQDGKALLISADFGTILWDVATGKVIRKFPSLTKELGSSAISPDGKFVLLGDGEGTVTIWDVATGVHKRNLAAHLDGVSSVTFSPDSQSILTGTNHGAALLWGAAADHAARVLEGHAGEVANTAFSPDGRQLLTAADDRWAIVWNASTGEKVHAFDDIIGYHSKMAYSRDGKSAVTLHHDDESIAQLTSVITGEIIQRFQKHKVSARSAAINAAGTQVLVGLETGLVTLWDVASGIEIRNFDTDHEHVRTIAFSPDGKTAVTQSNDGSTMLWETQTGRRLHTLQEFVEPEEPAPCQGFFGGGTGQNSAEDHTAAAAVAFSPDGNLVLAASDNLNVTIWETANGQNVRLLEGHTGDVTSVVCSADGRFVVTGSKDGTARLWKLSNGRELARLMSFDAGRAWAVVTPELLFDGSPNAVNYLAYRIPGTNRLATTAEMERCRRKELLRSLLRSE